MGSWQGEHWLMGRVWPPLLLLTQIQKHCRHKYISTPRVQCKKQYNKRKYKKTVGVWHFKVPCVQCSGSTLSVSDHFYWSHRFLSETRDTKAALFGDGNVDKSLLILSEKQKSCVLLSSLSCTTTSHLNSSWYCQTNKIPSSLLSSLRCSDVSQVTKKSSCLTFYSSVMLSQS